MSYKSQSVIERKSKRKLNAPLYLGLAWGKSIDTGVGGGGKTKGRKRLAFRGGSEPSSSVL